MFPRIVSKLSSARDMRDAGRAAPNTGVEVADDPGFPAYRSAEEILAHPRYADARRALITSTLVLYDSRPALSRQLQEAGRNTLFVIIMCLNARFDEKGRDSWPTLRAVTRAAASQGVSSARRIHDLIMEFVRSGFVELRRLPSDRRIRLVAPSPRMIAHDQDWLIAHYLPLQILYPDPGYGAIMRRDPNFQVAQRIVASQFLSVSRQLFADHAIITHFLARSGGVMTLLKLMALESEGKLASASFAEIGKQFGASRTQIRKLLVEACEFGLLEFAQDDLQVRKLTPALYDAFDRFNAAGMSGHDLIYQMTARSFSEAANRQSTGWRDQSASSFNDAP